MRHRAHSKLITKGGPIDNLALIVSILQPLTTVPQIYLIYSSHDASGVSFFMWSAYNIASIILLIYGFKHRILPIICAQTLWLVVQTPMMLSVFVFSK
jgi:uncharacterized protein with PQ loop repeat